MSLDLSILSIKTSFTTSTTATCIYILIFPLFHPLPFNNPHQNQKVLFDFFFFIQIPQEPGTTSGKCSFSILGFGNPKKPKKPKEHKEHQYFNT